MWNSNTIHIGSINCYKNFGILLDIIKFENAWTKMTQQYHKWIRKCTSGIGKKKRLMEKIV